MFLFLLPPENLLLYLMLVLRAGSVRQIVQVKPVFSGNDSSECCWQCSGVIC